MFTRRQLLQGCLVSLLYSCGNPQIREIPVDLQSCRDSQVSLENDIFKNFKHHVGTEPWYLDWDTSYNPANMFATDFDLGVI